jgi:flagellar motility protein MotE (MotC chaperone)
MTTRVRLLPAAIFVAVLTLSVKLGSLWQGVELAFFTPAVAEAKSVAKPRGPGEGDAVNEKSTADNAAKLAPGAAKVAAAEEKDKAKDEIQFDPAQATDAEVEVLHKLAKRHEELQRRSRSLEMREVMLGAAERRIEAKISELAKVQATIEKLLRKHDAQEETKLKSLVKIYENMKPKDAARIFERLELAILLDVFERMREAKSAPILAKMKPAKAKAVTTALAARRTLPSPAARTGDEAAK